MKMKSSLAGFLGVALLSATTIGCATSSAVDKKIAEAQAQTDQKIESVAGQVEDLQQKQKVTDQRLDELSKASREALERATQAGVLAKGKVAFEQTLTEERVHFKLASAKLSPEAKQSLDELAAKVKALDTPAYIEIQGYTDSTGSTRYNDMLGLERAEAARRYLSKNYNIPLGRMSTISYGEEDPIASNKTRQGRTQNRRVVLVVLQ